jgi:hypothetical protein
MQSATTVVMTVAALFFSLSCALLLEELVFGALFRLFFAPQPKRSKPKTNLGHK